MAAPPPPPYNPAPYIRSSSGLTADDLAAQFESFKDSLRYATAAPELVFERVLANLLASIPGLKRDEADHKRTEQANPERKNLQGEPMTLEHDADAGDAQNSPDIPVHRDSRLSDLPPAVIKFSWCSYGVQAESCSNDYDLYNRTGYTWQNLGYSSSGCQYGTYNTLEGSRGIALREVVEKTIQFTTPFDNTPHVVVWLTGLDMRCGKLSGVRTFVIRCDKTQFTVGIRTFGEGLLYSAGISWAAFLPGAISQGQFEVPAYASCANTGKVSYSSTHRPSNKFVVVEQLVMSEQVQLPIYLCPTTSDNEGIPWALGASMTGSNVCLLGFRYVHVLH